MLFFFQVLTCSEIKYGIIIDAGSSGTRAWVYTWDNSEKFPDVQPAPNKENPWSKEVDIKLADASKDPTTINKIFDDLCDYLVSNIPKAYHERTNIFVFATAGMRLLTAPQQQVVISSLYNYLTTKTPFKVKPKNVRVIDGISEGVYGWLSVNHLLGNFKENKQTYGALDCGGASFQIALQLDDNDIYPDMHSISIGNKKVKVFAHSYLGYGVDESLKTIIKSLSAVSENITVYSPCHPVGYKGQVSSYDVIGIGNFEKCAKLAKKILIEDPHFETINIPGLSLVNQYYAMASFHYTNSFHGLQINSTLEDLKSKAVSYCSKQWSQIKEEINNSKKLKYASTYCYTASYHYMLLSEGFHFSDDKTKVLKSNDINSVDLSWTIGAMLAQVNDIEINDVQPASIAFILTVNFFLLLVLIPIYIYISRKFRPNRGYSGGIQL